MLLSQATLVGILMTMCPVRLHYHPFALKHVFLELVPIIPATKSTKIPLRTFWLLNATVEVSTPTQLSWEP